MVSGFGTIDYIVVSVVVIYSIVLLCTKPSMLLLWLPLFSTIDFFIPVVTQLTPSRILPLILGVWLIISGRTNLRIINGYWIIVGGALIILSICYSLIVNDAGIRPVFRTANYLGLFFVFLFTSTFVINNQTEKLLLWGLVLAAGIHFAYSLYQIVASQLGLPFRGIVYGATGYGGVSYIIGGIRVNGLADEPKRLGYILFSGALAVYYFILTNNNLTTKTSLILLGLCCLGISVLTYSASYFVAVAATILVLSLRSRRLFSPAIVICCILGGVYLVDPDKLQVFVDRIESIYDFRSQELSAGLDANRIYRQELFGKDYLSNNPETYLTGVGVGRYNQVLYDEYGADAGLTISGVLRPFNSQYYEILFDFGLMGVILFYASILRLILKLGNNDLLFFTLSSILTFLTIQSITIQDLHFVAIVAGGCCGMLESRRAKARPHLHRALAREAKKHTF